MKIRKWIAKKLWPDYAEKEKQLYFLQSDIDYAYLCLCEFDDICKVLDWVRGKRDFGDSDISSFREFLRKKPHDQPPRITDEGERGVGENIDNALPHL